MRRSRGEMYIGHGRLCVCLSLAAVPHYCMDPDVTWGNGSCAVVHYWADSQPAHEFRRCYNNIAPNAKCQRVPVLALCLVCMYIFTTSQSCSSVRSTNGSGQIGLGWVHRYKSHESPHITYNTIQYNTIQYSFINDN